MSEIIDFNKIKNKVTDKDLEKFEAYIFNLYYSMSQNKLNFNEFNHKIIQYMNQNNISQEKFSNIQKGLIEKYSSQYGIDFKIIEEQIQNLGLNLEKLGIDKSNLDYENLRKTMSFHEKYNKDVKVKNISEYFIKNEHNNVKIILDKESVTLISKNKVDLNDNELNEFLCSYKKLFNDNPIEINLCENSSYYKY